ncbi:MAG: peptidoglycan-binding protein, partial [Verrucomicrobiota bacterium]|nr:peptidoglycan-binding protein [Verrucomicrobiota bacterium]
MTRSIYFLAAIIILSIARAEADPVVANVQQTLKEQGFYYGEISGQQDADTTAALRRYQIRNGLRITGDLDAETRKSLGVKAAAPTPAPRAQTTPAARISAPRISREVRAEPTPRATMSQPLEENTMAGRSVFSGTVYEFSDAQAQMRVLAGAQSSLARRGYYRGMIDGIYGPEMAFALRAFQSRFGLEPNGRLDTRTLGALGLLPGQAAPGL